MNDLLERLAALAKRGHYYCDDHWYSCPKAEDGCANEGAGYECNCGADEHNAKVDALVAELRSNAELRGASQLAGAASRSNAELGEEG